MSDYGFATYDEKNSNKRIASINSKWPIFGPEYNNISNAYKTYHISDATSSVAKNVDLGISKPTTNYGETDAYHYDKIEVFRKKHGFKKRPLGYVIFTGNVAKNVRCYIRQYHEGGSGGWGGDFELSGVNNAIIPISSSLQKQMGTAYTESGYDPLATTLEDSVFTIYDGSSYFPSGDLRVPTACVSAIKTTYHMYNGNDPDDIPVPGGGLVLPPYSVEITDEDIVVYKNVYSCDIWWRFDSGSSRIYDRIKGITDFAGSEVDMTVFLCPYTMEDLL